MHSSKLRVNWGFWAFMSNIHCSNLFISILTWYFQNLWICFSFNICHFNCLFEKDMEKKKMWNQWHYKRRIDIFYFKVNQSRSLDREMVLRRGLQIHLKWQLAHLKSKSIFPSTKYLTLILFCNRVCRPFPFSFPLPRIFGDKQKHNSFSIYKYWKL